MKLKILKFLDWSVEYSTYVFIFYIPISIALVGNFSIAAVALFFIKQFLSSDFSTINRHKVFFVLLLVFFICMSLSLINSGPLLGKSLKALFIKWGRFPFILWMILDTFKKPGRIIKALGVLLFSTALTGFSALSQKFIGLEFLRHQQPRILTGPFSDAISFAFYLLGSIFIAWSLSLYSWRHKLLRIGFCSLTLMIVIVLFLTRARGAWIGCAAGLIFMTLAVNCHRLRKKTFWILFAASYMVVLPLFTVGLYLLRKDPQRMILMFGALRMIREHPLLGKGLGTFMNYCEAFSHNPWVCYAHNCFLQIWAESGIFSLVSFVILMGYVLYRNMKLVLKTPISFDYYLLIGLNATFLSLLVHIFFDTQLYSFQSSFLFWTMLGFVMAHGSFVSEKYSLQK